MALQWMTYDRMIIEKYLFSIEYLFFIELLTKPLETLFQSRDNTKHADAQKEPQKNTALFNFLFLVKSDLLDNTASTH